MSLFATRRFNAIVILILLSASALSAVAQGQTPTTPQQSPAGRVRPSPSSGIPWDADQTGDGAGSSITDSASGSRIDRSGGDRTGRSGSAEGQEGQPGTGQRIDRSKDKGTAKPAAKEGTAAEKAAADTGPGKEPPKARDEGTGPRTIGGAAGAARPGAPVGLAGSAAPAGAAAGAAGAALPGKAGAAGAGYSKGAAGSVSMIGEGAFEPILEREPVYEDVPEAGEKITLEGPMPLEEFLAAINLATNWNVMVSPELQEVELRFWIFEVSPKQALEVLKFNKIFYEFDEEMKFLRVMTEAEYLEREYGKTKPHEFKVQNADVTYIESLVNSLLSPTGRAVTDQRTSNIYVWDTEDNINEMIRIVDEIDVPLQKAEFSIQYAEVADIEAVLATFMSASGSVLSDVRTGQVFVWDSPTILDKMREAVERLDQPVESRTFYITHVSSEDVVGSIESMLTERGTIQVDPRYNTVVVTDLPARIEKIAKIVETLDKPLDTRTWVLRYADLDFVADQIEAYIPGEMGQIVVQDEVHQITVTGLPSRLDEIDKLIQEWDIRRRQVLIEAHIVEVSTDVERAFNVNWSSFSNVNGSPFVIHGGSGSDSPAEASGGGQIASGGRSPYAVPRYGALQLDESGGIVRPLLRDINGETIIDRYVGGNLAVTLDYLDKNKKATILSSPRVTVQDGEEAIFENATKVPYVSSTGGGYGGYYSGYSGIGSDASDYYRRSSAATSRVEFIDVGTILSVLPRITEEGNILLDISAEDSTFTDKSIVVDDLERTVPEKTLRRADTQVRVNTGDTIVLGGLRRDRAEHSTTRTPILGDIPIIGKLFNSPNRSSNNNSLMIFITTTVVDESTQPEAVGVAQAEQDIADAKRKSGKGPAKRLKSAILGDKDEIGVSIGQTGSLHCAGEIVTVENLSERFFDAQGKKPVTVVIRKHPNAPIEVVNQVTEAAMEAGLRIEFDNDLSPIVPSIRTNS